MIACEGLRSAPLFATLLCIACGVGINAVAIAQPAIASVGIPTGAVFFLFGVLFWRNGRDQCTWLDAEARVIWCRNSFHPRGPLAFITKRRHRFTLDDSASRFTWSDGGLEATDIDAHGGFIRLSENMAGYRELVRALDDLGIASRRPFRHSWQFAVVLGIALLFTSITAAFILDSVL